MESTRSFRMSNSVLLLLGIFQLWIIADREAGAASCWSGSCNTPNYRYRGLGINVVTSNFLCVPYIESYYYNTYGKSHTTLCLNGDKGSWCSGSGFGSWSWSYCVPEPCRQLRPECFTPQNVTTTQNTVTLQSQTFNWSKNHFLLIFGPEYNCIMIRDQHSPNVKFVAENQYKYCIKREQSFDGQLLTVNDLHQNTIYKIFVVTMETPWKAGQVSLVVLRTKVPKPGAPANIVLSYTSTGIEASWSRPSSNASQGKAIKYLVRISPRLMDDDKVTTSETKTSFQDLKPCTSYCVTVASQNEGGQSQYSSEVCKYTNPGQEDIRIRNLQNGYENHKKAAWNFNINPVCIADFNLSYWTAGRHDELWKKSTDGGSYIEVTGLKVNKKYCFRLQAIVKDANNGNELRRTEAHQLVYTGNDRPSVTHLRMEWSKPDQFHEVLWQIAEEDRSTFNSFSLRVNGYQEYTIFCSNCAAGAVFKCGDISSTTAGQLDRKSGNNSYIKSSTYFSIMIPSKNKTRQIHVSLYGQHRFSGLIFLSNTTLKSVLLQRYRIAIESHLGIALTFIVLVLIVICAIGLFYRYRIVKAVFKPTFEIEDNVYESVRSNNSASQRIQPSSNRTPIQTEMTQRIPSSTIFEGSSNKNRSVDFRSDLYDSD